MQTIGRLNNKGLNNTSNRKTHYWQHGSAHIVAILSTGVPSGGFGGFKPPEIIPKF
jgi:hypothetical protein